MAGVKQVQIGNLKEGNYVVIEGEACRVTEINVSRPGKHGHAKVRLTGVGIIDGKKRVIVAPGHDNVDVPIIEKKDAQVLSVSNDKANVMDLQTYETFDLEIPEELKDSCKEGVVVLYWDILGKRMMKQIKSSD